MLWGDISILSGAAVVAQWFIYSQVQDFGALAFAATMNVRQIVSVVASNLIWRHHHMITVMQIIGLCLVAAALLFQTFTGCLVESAAEKEKTPLVSKDGEKDPEEGITSANSAMVLLRKTSMAACCLPCIGKRTTR